jgi:ATP/maltotriose-dependent transcriptional regulator MalT
LADIKYRLTKNSLLLINAEGGMGKTTLAAKYLNDNLAHYKHFAWLFCEKGIIEEIKTIAPKLHVDLAQYQKEEAQLLAIKTAMENLDKNCLLILDNANEPKHIETFQKHFGGLHWHVCLPAEPAGIAGK